MLIRKGNTRKNLNSFHLADGIAISREYLTIKTYRRVKVE
jgi:hypothetical protein